MYGNAILKLEMVIKIPSKYLVSYYLYTLSASTWGICVIT